MNLARIGLIALASCSAATTGCGDAAPLQSALVGSGGSEATAGTQSSGNGGASTGGTAAVNTGGTVGANSGGSVGSSTGGANTGGSASTNTGGSASTSTGGSATSGSGGAVSASTGGTATSGGVGGSSGAPGSTGGKRGSGGSNAGGGGAGTGGSAGATGTGGSPAGGAVSSSGCGKTATTGSATKMLSVNGTTRNFSYEVPANYDPKQPIPVVIGFHGSGGNGVQAYNFGIISASAQAKQNALFLFPDGQVQSNGNTGWNTKMDSPDLAFFDALLDFAKTTFCIDEKRVFLAGFSWGCDFANAVGCFRPDKVRAINGFSGALYSSGCAPTAPAYRTTYSVPDGTDAYSQSRINSAIQRYRDAQHCATTTQAVTPGPCKAYDGCDAPVIFCEYQNMGHSIPPDGGKDAWTFFSSFK